MTALACPNLNFRKCGGPEVLASTIIVYKHMLKTSLGIRNFDQWCKPQHLEFTACFLIFLL